MGLRGNGARLESLTYRTFQSRTTTTYLTRVITCTCLLRFYPRVDVGLLGRFRIAALMLPAARTALGEPRFVDLSLLVAPEYPVTWPANWPFFQINPYLRIGPLSAYNSEILTIDGNTGTQVDFPPHSIPAPGTNLPNAGPLGLVFGEKVPAWQFVGEACVIDVTRLIDKAPNGKSSLIYKDEILNWEKKHRPLGFGDIVLFRSGYSDKYFRPFPDGRRFAAEPVEGKTPGWPDPDPETMDYLGRRGVMALGTDSREYGPHSRYGGTHPFCWTQVRHDLDRRSHASG